MTEEQKLNFIIGKILDPATGNAAGAAVLLALLPYFMDGSGILDQIIETIEVNTNGDIP